MEYCGWPIAGAPAPWAAPSGAPEISDQDGSSRSVSRPGSTTAPCDSLATVAISAAVEGIEPVEPAMITGASLLAKRSASAAMSRSRAQGRLDGAAFGQNGRPSLARELEEFQRQLPIGVELVGYEIVEMVPWHLPCGHVVDHARQIIGERQRCRRILRDERFTGLAAHVRRRRPAGDELSEQQTAFQPAQRRRQIERLCADAARGRLGEGQLVLVEIADGDDARQERRLGADDGRNRSRASRQARRVGR